MINLEEHLDDLWKERLDGKSFQEVEQQYRKISQIVTKIRQTILTESEIQEIVDETQSQQVLLEIIRTQANITEKFIKHNEAMMTDTCWFEANMSVPYGERYMKHLLKNELISWDEVAMFQPMSVEFAIRYGEYLHIPYLQNNEQIDQELFDKKGVYVALTLIQ